MAAVGLAETLGSAHPEAAEAEALFCELMAGAADLHAASDAGAGAAGVLREARILIGRTTNQ